MRAHQNPTFRGWKLYCLVALPACWLLAYLLHLGSKSVSSEFGLDWLPSSSTSNHRTSNTLSRKTHRDPIKPIAYVFPQFHPIPENDEFWGVNFTEWVNVQKVTTNVYGGETLRPAEEVGYYNLLDYDVRVRQSKFLKQNGFYGVAYHHYWFGRPVMERVLTSMLEDGEPDMPFMLSWANEPWTARWDGNDASKVLLKQDYGGIDGWRKHYDWMRPFFKHRNYIRIRGKVQMMVYNPSHMGDLAPKMFAAWRKWAEEDGLGGMDIMETFIGGDGGFNRRNIPDCVNEFAPRSGGQLDSTEWVGNDKIGKIFHRGGSVCWDNTPRHATDGGGSANPWCHYDLWKHSMVEIMRRMKLEPNPYGEENLFFVNALNEWGEGNVLEPSAQWGDGYGKAFKEAMDIVHDLPWEEDLIERGQLLTETIQWEMAELCVLIRDYPSTTSDGYNNPFGPRRMLRSLLGQEMTTWRAVIFDAEGNDDGRVKKLSMETYDPRIRPVAIPEEIRVWEKGDKSGSQTTDWVVSNLTELFPSCANAKYVLFTNSSSTYGQAAFNLSSNGVADIIGLNFVSTETMNLYEGFDVMPEQRCSRFTDGTARICQPCKPDSGVVDLGAVFLRLERFVSEGRRLHDPDKGRNNQAFLRSLRAEMGWDWVTADEQGFGAPSCHYIGANTYTGCLGTGRFWTDTPDRRRGCHSLHSITGHFSWDTSIWDLKRFKHDPICLRHPSERYDDFNKPFQESPGPQDDPE